MSSNIYNYHVDDQLYIVCIKAVWMPRRLAVGVFSSYIGWFSFIRFDLLSVCLLLGFIYFRFCLFVFFVSSIFVCFK